MRGRLRRHRARAGAALIDVVVASPGRQARNADQLVHSALARGRRRRRASSPARRRPGSRSRARSPAITAGGAVAVCDVGGGSAQLAVGTVERGPAWLRSVDLGSLRLSARVPTADPPAKEELAALRREAHAASFAR